VGAGGL